MPESSDELSRRHVYDQSGLELETHILYRNQLTVSRYYRAEDGSLKEETVTSGFSKRKSRIAYSAGGKIAIDGEETRADGTLIWTLRSQADGSVKKTTFWYDGTRVFSEKTIAKNGRFNITYFRKSGAIFGTASGKMPDIILAQDFFNSTRPAQKNQATTRVEYPNAQEKVATISEANGSKIRGIFKAKNSIHGTAWIPQVIEEYDVQGKLVRKAYLDEYGNHPQRSETFTADGSKIVRTIEPKWNIYDEYEERFDTNGISSGRKSSGIRYYGLTDYQEIGNRKDTFLSIFFLDTGNDPELKWYNQEMYPQYRNED